MLSRLRVGPTPKEIEDVVREVKVHHPKADVREMVRAFELAQVAHEGQLRKSGELFIEHPIGVARILARLGMDSTTIVGALLHDAVEDTDVELEDIEGSFGPEVALIIDGLTKLDKIQFRTKEQERAENLRKMIVAMAKDLRVLIIKLADRLHNMRTLTALAPAKREHVATETLEIYAPLADRLGMQPIRVRRWDRAHFARRSMVRRGAQARAARGSSRRRRASRARTACRTRPAGPLRTPRRPSSGTNRA